MRCAIEIIPIVDVEEQALHGCGRNPAILNLSRTARSNRDVRWKAARVLVSTMTIQAAEPVLVRCSHAQARYIPNPGEELSACLAPRTDPTGEAFLVAELGRTALP